MVYLFNKTVMKIISNCIPQETVTFDDSNPPWISKNVKQLILEKNELNKKYIKENKDPKIVWWSKISPRLTAFNHWK